MLIIFSSLGKRIASLRLGAVLEEQLKIFQNICLYDILSLVIVLMKEIDRISLLLFLGTQLYI